MCPWFDFRFFDVSNTQLNSLGSHTWLEKWLLCRDWNIMVEKSCGAYFNIWMATEVKASSSTAGEKLQPGRDASHSLSLFLTLTFLSHSRPSLPSLSAKQDSETRQGRNTRGAFVQHLRRQTCVSLFFHASPFDPSQVYPDIIFLPSSRGEKSGDWIKLERVAQARIS